MAKGKPQAKSKEEPEAPRKRATLESVAELALVLSNELADLDPTTYRDLALQVGNVRRALHSYLIAMARGALAARAGK